ncbi:hypothetical protein [Frisingicoccus sp.]|uniref:hypothetical protein n=1 Tax=Frisingicoccus sp. TaxID=1918627 RepID=UPI002E75AEFD|nr:hypothetical protein [Frisingicoccus sp.]MEE0753038.1 hypothetical protein [Frisingicoccus sp.]
MSANCKDAAGCGRETYVSNEFYISGTEAAGIRCFYFTPGKVKYQSSSVDRIRETF